MTTGQADSSQVAEHHGFLDAVRGQPVAVWATAFAAVIAFMGIGLVDPILPEIAKQLEDVALNDEYFVERKLYPNVDFYSGVLYRAMGIPTNMFTVMFALGRLPGWIAHLKELRDDPASRINRPRQIYTGATVRDYTPIADR